MDDIHSLHVDQPVDLRDYLAVLRARKWTIVLTTLVVIGAALAYSFQQTPLYTSEARLLVKSLPASPNDYYLLPPNLETEGELVSSEPVAQRVAQDLDTNESPSELLDGLSVDSVIDSEVLVIRYTSPDPRFARAAADSFSQSYIDYRVDEALEGLLAAEEAIQQRVDSLREQLADTASEIDEANRLNDTETATTLESEQGVLIARLGVLQQQLDDVQPDRAIRLGGGSIIEAAEVPSSPSSPKHVQSGVVAAALGLALGIGLAFLRERLDDSFRGRTDVVRALQAPALATIPRFKSSKKKRYQLTSLTEPHASSSEAYRSLRTNIQFLATERETKVLLVTSPGAGEGKTVTSANLSVAFAQAGNAVVLISADLRRPTVESYFGVESGLGLSDWLLKGEQPIWDILKAPADVPNLRVLPAGTIPPNPAELLSSSRMVELIGELKTRADLIIIDSPPTLPVADASILSTHAGGTILVIDAGDTKRSAAMRAKDELERVGAHILGSVLNSYDPSASYSHYDSHAYGGYYYGSPPQVAGNGQGKKKKRLLSFRK